MSILKLSLSRFEYTHFLTSLKASPVEIISDKEKAELVKDIIVKLILKLLKRYDSLKLNHNVITLTRLEMIAYRSLMKVNYEYLCEYDKIIVMEVLTAIDKKEIYTIKPFNIISDGT